MKRNITLITPCGTFGVKSGNIKMLFAELPEHKFGWDFYDFYGLVVEHHIENSDKSIVIDLTK